MFESIHMPEGAHLLFVAAVFVVAGLVKGFVGLGLPTASMAMLSLAMTPANAAALLIVPSLITNVWQMRPWSTLGAMLRRLWRMQAGVVIGTLAGAWILGAPAGAWAAASLGIALIAYAAWSLSGARASVTPRTQGWLGPVAGALTGIVTAATGVFVVPAVPYLQALDLTREELMQAMGLSFTVSTLCLAVALQSNGAASADLMGSSALMLAPAILGMGLGQWLAAKLSPRVFRQCFLASLLLLGGHMLVRALTT